MRWCGRAASPMPMGSDQRLQTIKAQAASISLHGAARLFLHELRAWMRDLLAIRYNFERFG